MDRRCFLGTPALLFAPNLRADSGFPAIQAVPEPHFPGRLHEFVWRNWELANLDRMADVVQARPKELDALGRDMGLPAKRQFSRDYLRRIYITVIRQNWHLLPEQQLIQLLGWDEAKFTFTLKEDDFLEHKLGLAKPACDKLRYSLPDASQRKRAAEIRARLSEWFQGGLRDLGQERFAFVKDFSRAQPGPGWMVESPDSLPALAAAAERFGSGREGAKTVQIVIDQTAKLGQGDYSITPTGKGARIVSRTERAAIRALYDLCGRLEWPVEESVSKETWSPRFLYSYFALYGDPLMEGDAAGLPDGYLDRAAANGIDGVWIQGVLNTLAPSPFFPEFGKGHEIRLRNLRALVDRAAKFGIRVHLYLNEPRAMPDAFFRNRAAIRGTRDKNVFAMCTSAEQVRDWIRQSLSHVFRETPGLGGILTITMSENHTNCFSHGGAWGDRDPVASDCPRCSKRTGAETIGELIQTLRDGVREHSRDALIMSYDWGWGTPLAEALIPKLPKDTSIISISEWSAPVSRGGVKTSVGEYAMSVVGPGPRATRNWDLARKNGLAALAKTQFNNTWEISAVPYIPVLPLVLDHCENLAKAAIGGVMASWTCGGYPSPNLRAAAAYATEPRAGRAAILETEAKRVYGAERAKDAVRAWEIFSAAFQSFPYGVAIYILPVQHGPANPLRLRPTGLAPGMILFPYDAYDKWSGAYPPEIVQQLMMKLAERWREGVEVLSNIRATGKEARLELAAARTCQTHFESTANQVEFYLLRDEAPKASPARQAEIRARLIAIAERERELARQQFEVTRAESLIAYEASNHYYYTPLDLVEKMLNCDEVIAGLRAGGLIGAAAENR